MEKIMFQKYNTFNLTDNRSDYLQPVLNIIFAG